MSVAIGQVYKDNDPRVEGRTIRVAAVDEDGTHVQAEVVTNANDIQGLIDDPDGSPGTRSYKPKDRRGKVTRVKIKSLESRRFSLVSEPGV